MVERADTKQCRLHPLIRDFARQRISHQDQEVWLERLFARLSNARHYDPTLVKASAHARHLDALWKYGLAAADTNTFFEVVTTLASLESRSEKLTDPLQALAWETTREEKWKAAAFVEGVLRSRGQPFLRPVWSTSRAFDFSSSQPGLFTEGSISSRHMIAVTTRRWGPVQLWDLKNGSYRVLEDPLESVDQNSMHARRYGAASCFSKDEAVAFIRFPSGRYIAWETLSWNIIAQGDSEDPCISLVFDSKTYFFVLSHNRCFSLGNDQHFSIVRAASPMMFRGDLLYIDDNKIVFERIFRGLTCVTFFNGQYSLYEIESGMTASISSNATSNFLMIGSYDSGVLLLDATSGSLTNFVQKERYSHHDWTTAGNLAFGSQKRGSNWGDDDNLEVWDLESMSRLTGLEYSFAACVVSANGQFLLVCWHGAGYVALLELVRP